VALPAALHCCSQTLPARDLPFVRTASVVLDLLTSAGGGPQSPLVIASRCRTPFEMKPFLYEPLPATARNAQCPKWRVLSSARTAFLRSLAEPQFQVHANAEMRHPSAPSRSAAVKEPVLSAGSLSCDQRRVPAQDWPVNPHLSAALGGRFWAVRFPEAGRNPAQKPLWEESRPETGEPSARCVRPATRPSRRADSRPQSVRNQSAIRSYRQ
jgi:hypothetical protein